jgi:OPA family glycerol-3-phosphate transporter-like MFS transporter
MMSQLFDGEEYKKAALIVSWGSALGTMAVYLLSPVVLVALSWRWVFAICGGIGLIALVLWQFFPYRPTKEDTVQVKEKGNFSVFLSPIMAGIMVAIVLQGMLKDGSTTWMPSFIVETYHWSTAASILTAVILPIFSIISFNVSTKLYRTKFTNPLTCAGVFFGVGVLSAVGLFAVTGSNAGLSVFFSAFLTACMHGVNMMLISMLPPYFKRYGLTGTASGVLNACTYMGSALFTYGVAAISETVGWKSTVLLWGLIALLGTVICLVCAGNFKKKFM